MSGKIAVSCISVVAVSYLHQSGMFKGASGHMVAHSTKQWRRYEVQFASAQSVRFVNTGAVLLKYILQLKNRKSFIIKKCLVKGVYYVQ